MRPHIQDAITELCRADYHLATAATVLEELQLAGPQGSADKLMRECIALREQLAGERPMTPSERERRIEAAAAVIFDCDDPEHYERLADIDREQWRDEARQALEAADREVPTVSEKIVSEMVWLRREEQKCELEQRIERAEAAARDFAKALREIENHPWRCWLRITATRALNDHPSFSVEEGEGERCDPG